MLECVVQTDSKCCLKYFEIAWLTMLKNRS